MIFPATDESAEVVEPSEEPLNLPAAAIAAEWTTILDLGPLTAPTMGCDHLDTQLRQRLVQRVGMPAKCSPIMGAGADKDNRYTSPRACSSEPAVVR